MSDASNDLTQLYDLAGAQCEGVLTVGQAAQLQELVIGSQDLRFHYIIYMHIHALAQLGRCVPASGIGRGRTNTVELPVQRFSDSDSSSLSPAPTPGFLSTPIHGAVGYFSSGWPLAYLIATVIFGIGLLVGALVHVSQPVQMARELPPATADKLASEPKIEVVGRITGMANCKWADSATEAINGAQVPCGRTFGLSSGLMEITYDTGAKVILQGPVTYEVESAEGGYLSLGRMTAKVEKKAEGGRRKAEGGLFTIPYPLSTICRPYSHRYRDRSRHGVWRGHR